MAQFKTDVNPSKHITIGTIYWHPYTNTNYIENFTGTLLNLLVK